MFQNEITAQNRNILEYILMGENSFFVSSIQKSVYKE